MAVRPAPPDFNTKDVKPREAREAAFPARHAAANATADNGNDIDLYSVPRHAAASGTASCSSSSFECFVLILAKERTARALHVAQPAAAICDCPVVTPEMRKAGAAALEEFSDSYDQEMLAEAVYSARSRAATVHKAMRRQA